MMKNRVGSRGRGFGKVSKKMAEMSIIKITCGSVKGRLHKNKFYCPGIHRECIEFQGRFITPKVFSVMGDKEKLKDWKNAIRINGIQVRKYIESSTLDFYRHDEFCTGRCIARSPVNRNNVISPPTLVPKVEFVSSINEHTYCHLPDDSESRLPNIPTIEMKGIPEPVDVKPNVALLQSLLEKPIASSAEVLPPDVAAAFSKAKEVDIEPLEVDAETAEEDRQFWIGIMELGLLEHFFREIKITLDIFKSDLVTHQVRASDAVRVSNIVRTLGLMRKLKERLSAFKSDMDQQQAKIDKEMEALKQKVTQFELRKQALKRKSEKFEYLMDMSANKKAFIIEKNPDSDDEDDDSYGSKEVVDVCFENEDEDEDDDEDTMDAPGLDEEVEREVSQERFVTVPTTAVTPTQSTSTSSSSSRPMLPLCSAKITTLPPDSSNSFVIKNNSLTPITVSHVPSATVSHLPPSSGTLSNLPPPSATVSVPPKTTDPVKKPTIIRQVLMDTCSDGEALEKLKEAAVMKLKESMATKLPERPKVQATGNNKPENTIVVAAPKPGPVKEKIKIIARCKIMPEASDETGRAMKVTPETVCTAISPTCVTYNPSTNTLSTTDRMEQGGDDTVTNESQQNPIQGSTNGKTKNITSSAVTKDLNIVVQPIEIRKRKPGPKSKTQFFNVSLADLQDASLSNVEGDPNKVTFESGCQTPIDGVRENPPQLEEKEEKEKSHLPGKPVVNARRSNRKTSHMFAWGVKSGSEVVDTEAEPAGKTDSESDCPDKLYTIERSQPSDMPEIRQKFIWDIE
ncbi:uncharacterized protein [Haliotis cracherodii]|uniref:uncharacterized protein n=1 Tax=Haliotis cracherodii TaxID=6455 RepID=UPI0039ED1823